MRINKLLVVDGHNVLVRSFHALKDLSTSSGSRIGGLYGFLKTLRYIVSVYSDHLAVVVFDGGKAPWRTRLYPAYKAGRTHEQEEEQDEGFVSIPDQVNMAIAVCSALGIQTVRLRGVEADDIASVLIRAVGAGVIYSSDKDFYQLVEPRVSVHRSVRRDDEDIIVTAATLRQETGYITGGEYRIAKALVGDTSDNIPGVMGVGEKTALEIIEAANLVSPSWSNPRHTDLSVLRGVAQASTKKKWNAVDAQWDDFMLAHKLTDLWRPLLSKRAVDWLRQSVENHKPILNELELFGMMRDCEFTEDIGSSELIYTMSLRRKFIQVDQINWGAVL